MLQHKKDRKSDVDYHMAPFDRLTTLIDHFAMQVRPASHEAACLVVLADETGQARQVYFRPLGSPTFGSGFEDNLFAASVEWGGEANPLLAALPQESIFDLQHDSEMRGLIALLNAELTAQRCGSGGVINRLGEVLIVRLLRAQIERGSTQAGLLAGLADPRISRAIVAMHDEPGRLWRNGDLAAIAGLSLSRFAVLFPQLVGESPASYLRRWRLTLAWQDVSKGDRVEAVARRYGYGSPDGFGRAFKKQFGVSPIDQRPRVGA